MNSLEAQGTIPRDRLEFLAHLVAERSFPEAVAEVREIERHLNATTSPSEWAELCYYAAQIFEAVGNYAEALSRAQAAYEFYKPTGENNKIAQLQFVLGLIYIKLGKLSEAEAELRDAYSSFRRIGDTDGMIDALNRQANIAFVRFDYSQAIGQLNNAIELCQRTGDQQRLGWLTGNLGRIYLFLGQRKRAIDSLRLSLKMNRTLGDEINLARTQLSLGFAYLLQSDLSVAREFLLSARSLIVKHNQAREMAIFHEYFAQLYLQEENFTQAKSELLAGTAIAEQIGPQSDLASQLFRLFAEWAYRTGDLDQAKIYATRAYSIASELNERIERGILQRLLALIELQQGDSQTAEHHFKESIATFEELAVKHELAITLVEAAKSGIFALQQSGDWFLRAEKLYADLEDYLRLFDVAFEAISFFIRQQDYDRALEIITTGERMAREHVGNISSLPSGQNVLEKLCSQRRLIEQQVAELATSASNEYRFFAPSFTGAGNIADPAAGVAEAMLLLCQPIQATAGALALISPNRARTSQPETEGEIKLVWQLNLPVTVAANIVKIVSRYGADNRPVWLSDCCDQYDFAGLLSAMVIPFNWTRERKAVILVGTREIAGSPPHYFAKTDFFFAVAFAEFVALRLIEEERRHLEDENRRLRQQLEERCSFAQVITQDQSFLEMLDRLELFKDSELPILLEGETGTGKDLIAKAVHYASKWKAGNFVAVSCSALPESMLESELFGHKKGAFTGAATDKVGLIQEADGGTLYLDEVAEVPLSVQVKLLRVLEEKELVRLGETKPRKVQCRIISSTNRDVRQAVTNGTFRKDLYYRLNAVNLIFPPLRKRKDDIPLLVDHYLKKFTQGQRQSVGELSIDGTGNNSSSRPVASGFTTGFQSVQLAPEVLRAFYLYDWPGNVRELINEIHRMLVLANGQSVIGAEYLSEKFQPVASSTFTQAAGLEMRLEQFEKELIERALVSAGHIKARAARLLGIPVTTLRYKMEKLGLNGGK